MRKERQFPTELEVSPHCKSNLTSSPHHCQCNYRLNPLNWDFILLSAAADLARRGLVIGHFLPSRRQKLYKPVRNFFSFYLKWLSLQYFKLTLTSWGHFNPVRGFMQLPVFSPCNQCWECGSIRLEIRWNFIALVGKLRGCNRKCKRIKMCFRCHKVQEWPEEL